MRLVCCLHPCRRARLAPASTLACAAGVALANEELPVYALEEVAVHDNLTSCRMVIDGKVSDLTAHGAMHPSEPAVIAPWCGRDATEGMPTKGQGEERSAPAWGLLERCRIGTLAVP